MEQEKLEISGIRINPRLDLSASNAYWPAGPNYYGFTNPHIALLDWHAEKYKGGLAYAILRKDFEIGCGLEDMRLRRQDIILKEKTTSRGWKTIIELCKEMPFEDALRIAEETAKRENIALYDNRTYCDLPFKDSRRFLWTPENWSAIVG